MFNRALKVVKKLNNNGYLAYIVGGAVRDMILEKECHDIDITTNAKPDEIEAVFSDCKTSFFGKKHGTIGVLFEDAWFEITTFRRDGEYEDNRRPKNVEFTDDLTLDLKRRDFTVNAMCYNPEGGYIDIFGGQADLKNGIIRAVGDPAQRFKEDALRILRAVRFSSQLGFKIEENTKKAITTCLPLINNISKERIYTELCKILQGEFVKMALTEYSDVLFEIIPEFKKTKNFDQKSLSHKQGVYEHILDVVSLCDRNDLVLRLMALFHDVGKVYCFQDGNDGYRHYYGHWEASEQIAKQVLTRLRAPNDVVFEVSKLCLYHDADLKTKYEIKLILSKHSLEFFDRLLKHKYCDLITHSEHGIKKYKPYLDKTIKLYNEIINNKECYKFSDLDFTGDDCIKLGIQDKKIGEVLSLVFDLVLKGILRNSKSIIENYIKHNIL